MISKEEILELSNSREPRWVHFRSIKLKIKNMQKEKI